MYQKSDSYDAEAVALLLINMLDKLPDADPDDAYWTLSQLVNLRDNICSHQQRLKNQLHEQLCVAYPSYKQFFGHISRRTALYFWLKYPSPEHLKGKSAEELAAELRPVSHNNCSTKRAEKIQELARMDGQTTRDHQASWDVITRSIAGDLEHYREQLEIVETAIVNMLSTFNCTLMTMPGVDVTTAANMLSEIGDINRFPNANKLAKFCRNMSNQLFVCGKRQGYVPEAGKQATTGDFLLSGNPDDSGFH